MDNKIYVRGKEQASHGEGCRKVPKFAHYNHLFFLFMVHDIKGDKNQQTLLYPGVLNVCIQLIYILCSLCSVYSVVLHFTMRDFA